MIRSHILVCGGTGCTSNKSHDIIDALNSELRAQGLENEVKVVMTGCFGLCANGPIMVVYPEGACYNHVTVDDVKEIMKELCPFPRRNSCRNRSESRCATAA